MSKRLSSIIIILGIVVITIVITICCVNEYNKSKRFTTKEGTIIKNDGIGIVFARDVSYRDEYIIPSINYLQRTAVLFDENGNPKDFRLLKEGDYIIVKFRGSILESIPGQIQNVFEIIVKE